MDIKGAFQEGEKCSDVTGRRSRKRRRGGLGSQAWPGTLPWWAFIAGCRAESDRSISGRGLQARDHHFSPPYQDPNKINKPSKSERVEEETSASASATTS